MGLTAGDVSDVHILMLVEGDKILLGEPADAYIVNSEVHRAAVKPAGGVRGGGEDDVVPATPDAESTQQREVPGKEFAACAWRLGWG
jgi:hypothetical protein